MTNARQGFNPQQTSELSSKLAQRHVRHRTVDGKTLSYIEGWHAIAEANRIFGFDCWDRVTVSTTRMWCDEHLGRFAYTYAARVRISVRAGDVCVKREGTGVGHASAINPGEAIDVAVKAAETDATKRALSTFGNPFGLALYDRTQSGVRKSPGPKPKQPDGRRSRTDGAEGKRPCDPVFNSSKQNGGHPGADGTGKSIAATQSANAASADPNSEAQEAQAVPRCADQASPAADPSPNTLDAFVEQARLEEPDRRPTFQVADDGQEYDDGPAFCSAIRRRLEDAPGVTELIDRWRANQSEIDRLRQNHPDLRTRSGRHYSDLLKAIYGSRLHNLRHLEAEQKSEKRSSSGGSISGKNARSKNKRSTPTKGATLKDRTRKKFDGADVTKKPSATNSAEDQVHKQSQPVAIDKSSLAIGTPKRRRDKAHLAFVAHQPCMICGRLPVDAHHVRFAQPRGLALKPGDDFTVPLCRTHHAALHKAGDENYWWTVQGKNPLKEAERLWALSRDASSGRAGRPNAAKAVTSSVRTPFQISDRANTKTLQQPASTGAGSAAAEPPAGKQNRRTDEKLVGARPTISTPPSPSRPKEAKQGAAKSKAKKPATAGQPARRPLSGSPSKSRRRTSKAEEGPTGGER